MQLRTCAGLGSASFDSFPVKELWADCVSHCCNTITFSRPRTTPSTWLPRPYNLLRYLQRGCYNLTTISIVPAAATRFTAEQEKVASAQSVP
jgi:hypothetical protein